MSAGEGPLRVALVGASASGRGWGPAAHLPAIQAAPGLELVALCTSSPASAAAAAETYGIPRAFHDVHELAEQDDVDLVGVAVRVPHHRAIALPLLAAGKHVYCEWPLGATTGEAVEMADAAAAGGAVAVAGLQGRHDPTLRDLRGRVSDGWLGEVVSVSVSMVGGGALAHRADDAWMADDANGASTMTIVGGHALDQLEFVFGDLVDLAATTGVQVPEWHLVDTGEVVTADAPDTVLLTGELASGALVSFRAASVPHNGSGWRLEAHGTEGSIVATSAALPQITPIEVRGSRGGQPLAPFDTPRREPAGLVVPAGPGHNIARSYTRMAEAIRDGGPATPDFRRAVRVHRLLDAIRTSSRERRNIGVAP